MNSANLYCRQIIALLRAHGVKTAYCSPGSRNAPLLVALEACEEMTKHIVVDERSAAFQAYGCALIERRPVAIICTSGSAVLDYAPAVAEAYYSGVPLIVVSADRPREWIDQEDSQTIRQFGVLDHIVKGSYDVRAIAEGRGREYTEDMKWTVNRTVNEAMLTALDGKQGPVHINVQLAEPLGEIEDIDPSEERCVSLYRCKETLPDHILNELSQIASESRIMLVAGFCMPDHKLDRAVRKFASLPNVVVMAESIANLHDPQPFSSMIDSVLCDMTEEEKKQMRPDLVISFGGALVSRMLKQYLREYPPQFHWSLGHSNYFCDCFKAMTHKIEVSPSSFLGQISGKMRKFSVNVESDYSALWYGLRKRSYQLMDKYLEKTGWSDIKALDYIFRHFSFDNLVLSNGTVVRYAQLFPHNSHAEYCNRGVSGIDGSTSTAVGAAWSYPGNTCLISGDISWLYDSGASALNNIPCDMRIIVMDNSGGGIFRHIKSTSKIPSEILERYFCVQDLPEIEDIAAAYSIETMTSESMQELESGLTWLCQQSDFPRLLIVRTSAEESARVLSDYFVKNL